MLVSYIFPHYHWSFTLTAQFRAQSHPDWLWADLSWKFPAAKWGMIRFIFAPNVCLCICGSNPLTPVCQSTTFKSSKNESSGAVGVYGSYWCHLTTCDLFFFWVPCCTTVISCHFWTYLEKLDSILQIRRIIITRRRKRRRWRRRTGREIGATSS